MRTIAIDQATKTGWASWDGTHTASGVQDFKLKRGESPGMRYIRFEAWLREICDLVRPGLLVYEEPHHRGGAATEVAYGLVGIIKKEAATRKIEHTSVHTATLKKWATGKGNASKEEMVAAANDWPAREGLIYEGTEKLYHVEDDNEADASLMLAYAREQFEKEGE